MTNNTDDFSDFFTNASSEEKEKVLKETVQEANQEQKKTMTNNKTGKSVEERVEAFNEKFHYLNNVFPPYQTEADKVTDTGRSLKDFLSDWLRTQFHELEQEKQKAVEGAKREEGERIKTLAEDWFSKAPKYRTKENLLQTLTKE